VYLVHVAVCGGTRFVQEGDLQELAVAPGSWKQDLHG
jgi:hypothetical protein